MNITNNKFLLQDIAIIAFSVVVAVFLMKTDILVNILTSTKELKLVGSFVAGIFFTSIFTTVPAIVTLGEIAQSNSIWLTALFGSMGSVVGDLVIFRFVRDRLSGHLIEIFKLRQIKNGVSGLFNRKKIKWLTFLVGALIIASPFPDELGISMLGFSKMSMAWFIPLALICNFIGILIIGMIAKSI